MTYFIKYTPASKAKVQVPCRFGKKRKASSALHSSAKFTTVALWALIGPSGIAVPNMVRATTSIQTEQMKGEFAGRSYTSSGGYRNGAGNNHHWDAGFYRGAFSLMTYNVTGGGGAGAVVDGRQLLSINEPTVGGESCGRTSHNTGGGAGVCYYVSRIIGRRRWRSCASRRKIGSPGVHYLR